MKPLTFLLRGMENAADNGMWTWNGERLVRAQGGAGERQQADMVLDKLPLQGQLDPYAGRAVVALTRDGAGYYGRLYYRGSTGLILFRAHQIVRAPDRPACLIEPGRELVARRAAVGTCRGDILMAEQPAVTLRDVTQLALCTPKATAKFDAMAPRRRVDLCDLLDVHAKARTRRERGDRASRDGASDGHAGQRGGAPACPAVLPRLCRLRTRGAYHGAAVKRRT